MSECELGFSFSVDKSKINHNQPFVIHFYFHIFYDIELATQLDMFRQTSDAQVIFSAGEYSRE